MSESRPAERAETIAKQLTWCAGFCEQVAHDGIPPSRAWFSENAPAMREAADLLVSLQGQQASREQERGDQGRWASHGSPAACVHGIATHVDVLLTDKQKDDINWHETQDVGIAVMRVLGLLEAAEQQIKTLAQERDAAQAWAREQSMEERALRQERGALREEIERRKNVE
jgi:hypothetical protein